MTDKTDSKEREALVAYLKDCDAHDIVPDVGGAWHAAFQAGRASLSLPAAGQEPVKLNPRHIRQFLQALQAGEMSVSRAVEILDAWVGGSYEDSMVPLPPADSCLIADDEFPMEIVRKLRAELAAAQQPAAPVAGQEPVKRVFIVATGEEHEGEATYTRYDDTPPPLCDSECLYAAPQPAVAAGWVRLPASVVESAITALDWMPTSDATRHLWDRQQPVLALLRSSIPPAPSTEGESNADQA